MIETRLRNARASFSGLLLAFVLAGCSELEIRPARDSRDRTFITSGPTSTSGGRLRLAVKDNIDVKGYVTSAGSEYLFKNTAPAARDAECMAIARARNVQIVGKTNLTEFALSVSGINGYFGTPWNPIDQRRRIIPGGSSSGSAVAVASGQADVAFGTDTAGSIRVPAACCGVAGLKTTFGLISLDGVFPIAPQYLDTVGPMARDIRGLVQGMDLLQSGFASRYRAANVSGQGIRVARLYVSGTDRRIDKAVDDALAAGGFQVVVLTPEFREQWEQAERDARTVATVNGWANDRQYLDKSGVSAKTKTIIAVGRGDHGAEYREALQRRVSWQRTLEQLFQRVDFIALPTLKQLPPEIPLIGRSAVFEDRVFRMQNTAAVNLAGNPALAMPIPVADKNIPVTSLQLIGRPRSEAALLTAGRLIEAGHKRAENQATVVASR